MQYCCSLLGQRDAVAGGVCWVLNTSALSTNGYVFTERAFHEGCRRVSHGAEEGLSLCIGPQDEEQCR